MYITHKSQFIYVYIFTPLSLSLPLWSVNRDVNQSVDQLPLSTHTPPLPPRSLTVSSRDLIHELRVVDLYTR